MPTMESDWQRRRHPLHDNSPPSPALPTLPGVAELIASSKPSSSSSIAAYHHAGSPLPPIRCSTPHNPPAATATAPAPDQLSYFGAAHHASHASPTGSATSTTPSERQCYQQSPAHPASTQGATFDHYHGEATHAQPPINSRRQDSAVAHHRPDTTKEGLSFAPPSEPNFAYSHRSPNDTHRPASPALASAPLPSTHHLRASSTTSHDHVTSPTASLHSQPALDPSPATQVSLPPDHSNTPNTRQQRYNVRFAANYTSANMPSVQRSRPSPPLPATTAPVEAPEPTPPTPTQQLVQTPSLDRARQAIIGSVLGVDGPLRTNAEVQESSVERCSKCLEAWSPPLPTQSERKQSPATSAYDYAMATDIFYAQQRQNARDADEAFAQWKEKHRQCPVQQPANANSNSHPPAAAKTPNNTSLNGHSSKRKSEISHGDSSKMRRHDFDGHITTAPPVQPSTSI